MVERADGSSRKRGLAFRAGLALASTVLAVGGVEILLRATSGPPWYEQLVEEQRHGGRIPKQRVGQHNLKVRQPLERSPKPEGTYRILFLGDSFTYGTGVKDEEALFSSRIERMLRERHEAEGGRDFEVYNGGIPGSLTGAWSILFREAATLFDPDLVVAVFFLRDGTRNLGSVHEIKEIRNAMREHRDRSLLFRYSCIYRFLFERRTQREVSRDYIDAMSEAYLGPEEARGEWKTAQANLLELRDETEARGATFAFVIFPVLFDLEGEYPMLDAMGEIERFGVENGLPTLSLLPSFQGLDPPTLWVSPLDHHPNERAHAIAAEAIGEFVLELVGKATAK